MSFLDKLRADLPSASIKNPEVDTPVQEGVNDINDIDMTGVDKDPEIDGMDFVDDLEKPESLELSPEEDAEADSIIDIAATPVILKEVLTKESVKDFLESEEWDIAVSEGFALEGTRDNFGSITGDLFTEAKFYAQNQVRFTKEARTNQLFEICVQAIARAKNDPVYDKLAKVQVMRRKLKAVLRNRYRQPAMKKAKEYIIRLRKSKAATIADAAKKLG